MIIAADGSSLEDYALFAAVVVLGGLVAVAGTAVLRRWAASPDARKHHRRGRLRVQGLLAVAGVLVGLLLILAFPTDSGVQDSLLTFYGVLVAAVIGLTSTTYVGNFLAGLILSNRASFSDGDFVRSGDLLGAVIRQKLLHTEIETEDGERVLIPNVRMVNEPLAVMPVDGHGIVVSTRVSLGYDVAASEVKRLLTQAALDANLNLCFAYVTSLGDFSVTYRAGGRLVKGDAAGREDNAFPIISTRSLLREQVLNRLHGADIEIVSPTFMNQRQLGREERFISEVAATGAEPSDAVTDESLNPETRKTRDVERLRLQREELVTEIESLQRQKAAGGDETIGVRAGDRLAEAQQRLDGVDLAIEAAEAAKDEG